MTTMIRGSAFYFGDEANAPDASFNRFFEMIKKADSEKQWPYHVQTEDPEITRRLYFDFNNSHWFGIFISARTNLFQHYVKRNQNRITIEAREVRNDPPVEINFFCIRRDSYKGIFSHYLGSYSFGRFLRDLWSYYRHFVDNARTTRLAHLQSGESQRTVNAAYSLNGKSRTGQLFTPQGFEDLLNALHTIDAVRCTTYSTDAPDDQPVAQAIRNVHYEYRFESHKVTPSVRNWLKKLRGKSLKLLTKGRTTHTGRIIGTGSHGSQLVIDFENSKDNYLNYEYDRLQTFEVDNVFSHPLIQLAVSSMDKEPLFEPAE